MEDLLAKYILELFDWFADERKNLLEAQWERNYDAFRGRYNSDVLKKWRASEGQDWRSKVFCRLTKQKVITGYNHVMALMLQGGKIPWSISPTPIPEAAEGVFLDPAEAEIRAQRMTKKISDDLVQCKADRVCMSSALEGAIYGLSWQRGPILRPFETMKASFGVPGDTGMQFPPEVVQRFGRYTMQREVLSRPVTENPSTWNVFWDLEHPDHQKGHGIVDLEMMSKGRFADLSDREGYDKAAIEAIQNEFTGEEDGSDETDKLGPLRERYTKRKRVIPVYSFHGRVPRSKLTNADEVDPGKSGREVEIFCVVAKGKTPRVIKKPIRNPLPYRRMYLAKWQDLPHEPGGVGTPEDVQDSQAVVNGLTRAMIDNKQLSANLLMMWNPRFLAPGQNKSVYPGKSFELAENADRRDQALDFYAPPDVTGNTPQLIEAFRGWADEESGINKMMEGASQSGQRTAFELNKIAQSGNKTVGGIIRNIDEGHTEPLITGYYHYYMIAGKDESLKGDYLCNATGYQSFQDKSIRSQNLLNLFQFALSNELTALYPKARKWLEELAKTSDMDPDEYWKTDDEVMQGVANQLGQMLPGPGPDDLPEGGVL